MSSFETSAIDQTPSVCNRNGNLYEVTSIEPHGDTLSVTMRQTRPDGTSTVAAREWDFTDDFYYRLDDLADDMAFDAS